MSPKVSVILYSYNHGRWIEQAVESVLQQTFGDWELIVSDNGSTDQTTDILRRYASRDRRIRLLLHPDNVLTGARWNEAIKMARGEFISQLHSDDYYLPRKLERQLECFSRLGDDYGVVYSPGYRLNDVTGDQWLASSFQSSGDILEALFLKFHSQGGINPISPLVRRACRFRYLFQEDTMCEGEGVFFRMALTSKFFFLNEPLVVMRDHLHNYGKAIKFNKEVFLEVSNRLPSNPEFPQRLRGHWALFMARHLRGLAWQGIRVAEDGAWARECLREAVRLHLPQIFHPRVLAALGLSLLPKGLLHWINRAAFALRKPRENVMAIEMPKTGASPKP